MPSSAPPSDQRDGKWKKTRKKIKGAIFGFVAPLLAVAKNMTLSNTPFYDRVTVDKREAAFVYEIKKPRQITKPLQQSGDLRVEIRRGHELWVIGPGDETLKVKLEKNNEMELSRATASMSTIDGVLTVVIPERCGPRKWYQNMDLALNRFKTVRVGISWS